MIRPDELARFDLFADLDLEQLAAVVPLASEVSFAAGRRIFDEGRPADRCWLIRTGLVRLEIALPNRAPETVGTVGPGDTLGWSWLLPPHRWRFDGVTVAAATAIELDGVALRELTATDTSLGYPVALRMAQVLADRLHGTRARLVDLYGGPRAD